MSSGRNLEPDATSRDVLLDLEGASIEGALVLPHDANGLVLFVHGSGSSRQSPRNKYVAAVLHAHRIATLLFDLLTVPEEAVDQSTGQLRFDIPFLAKRLIGATGWVMNGADTTRFKIGYFGASTGAAAALVAAAELPDVVSAVVSRGGRPDLAADALAAVRAPTLLIVGRNDEPVIQMNWEALAKLGSSDKNLIIVPGATHLFAEPGALEEVAQKATDWFGRHFKTPANSPVRNAPKRR